MKVIGIDIGTTTISLVVLDTEKRRFWNQERFLMGHL